jgi:hypothetical protein
LARGSIVQGKIQLAARRWADAYASFRAALGSGDARMRMRALRGMLSARLRGLIARERSPRSEMDRPAPR